MIILLAVGNTEVEENGCISGQIVSPLSDNAKIELNDVIETLRGYEIYTLYSSDMLSSQDTTEILKNKLKIENIEYCEELRERCLGEYEGKSLKLLREKLSPRHYRLWERDYFEAPCFGESLADLEIKVKPFFEKKFPRNKNILIVSHYDVIRLLIGMMRNDDEDEIQKMKIEKNMPYFFHF